MFIKCFASLHRFWFAIIILATVSLILAILVTLQGVRIREVVFDAQAASVRANQQMILKTNQPLSGIDTTRIQVSPTVKVRAIASGNTVVIQFLEKLQNNTQYTVRMTPRDNHVLTHSFKTPAPDFYYLGFDAKSDSSEIRMQTLGKNASKVFYRQKNIADFVVTKDAIFVTVQKIDAPGKLLRIDRKTGTSEQIALPKDFAIHDLRLTADQQMLGFTLVSTDWRSDLTASLYTYNIAKKKLAAVNSFDGKQMQAFEWYFAPDGKMAQVDTPDGLILLTDTTNKLAPLPLGTFQSIGGFTFDQSKVVVGGVDSGIQTVDIKTLQTNPLNPQLHNKDAYLTSAKPLYTKDGYIVQTETMHNGVAMQNVERSDTSNKVLFTQDTSTGLISNIEISPNDQYVVVETSNAYGEKTAESPTYIIETQTGKTVAKLTGNTVRWW